MAELDLSYDTKTGILGIIFVISFNFNNNLFILYLFYYFIFICTLAAKRPAKHRLLMFCYLFRP